MNVFIPWIDYEAITGAYLTLEEAVNSLEPYVQRFGSCEGIDEFEIGNPKRVHFYKSSGEQVE